MLVRPPAVGFSLVHAPNGAPAHQLVGPRRLVRAAAPDADRLERLLDAARQRYRSVASRVLQLDRAGYHGQTDEVKVLKKMKLREKDRVQGLLSSLREVRDATPTWELGSGSFGKVLLGRASAVAGGGLVAIKVEPVNHLRLPKVGRDAEGKERGGAVAKKRPRRDRDSPLAREARVLRALNAHGSRSRAFATIHHFGRQQLGGEAANVLVMELLGPNVEALYVALSSHRHTFAVRNVSRAAPTRRWWRSSCGTQLSSTCVLRLGLQMLACLRSLHELGWVHNDVKPSNFCVGLGVGAARRCSPRSPQPRRYRGRSSTLSLVGWSWPLSQPRRHTVPPSHRSYHWTDCTSSTSA